MLNYMGFFCSLQIAYSFQYKIIPFPTERGYSLRLKLPSLLIENWTKKNKIVFFSRIFRKASSTRY